MDLRMLVQQTHGLRNGKMLCPYHKEKTPSFNVTPTFFKCFGCGQSGDATRWLCDIIGMPLKEAKAEAAALGMGRQQRLKLAPKKKAESELSSVAKWGLERWAEATPAYGTPAGWYLQGRGLPCDFDSVRFHPGLAKERGGEPMPAMLVLVTDSTGRPTGVQATFLRRANDGAWRKESPKDSRRTLGTVKGIGSAKFGRMEHGIVAVAEGSESAIAACVMMLIPTEATLGGSNIDAWEPPAGTKEVILCAEIEHRERWLDAAERLDYAGLKVYLWCAEGKWDANDELMRRAQGNMPPAIHDLPPLALYDDEPHNPRYWDAAKGVLRPMTDDEQERIYGARP